MNHPTLVSWPYSDLSPYSVQALPGPTLVSWPYSELSPYSDLSPYPDLWPYPGQALPGPDELYIKGTR